MKRKKLLTVAGSIVAIAIMVLFAFSQWGTWHDAMVWGAGTPDAYGNKIQHIQIYQDGSWVLTLTTSNYTAGSDNAIDSNKNTYIIIRVYLNSSFASSAADAVSKTRAYLNVTGKYTNENLADADVNGTDGSFYYVDYGGAGISNWTTATDTDYVTQIKYQAYY